MPSAVVVESLSHRYGERVALREVTFSVAEGEIFALLGPNGGGKTTLFRIVATLLTPSEGTVRIAGHDVGRAPAAVRRTLGVVFQSPAIDQQLTVNENLHCHGQLYGLRGRERSRRAIAALERVGLADREGARAGTLSGGQQRRLELAKALLTEPRVLVLDEASTGLDPTARHELWAALTDLRRRAGTTIVLTTHLMDEAARCDRVAILDRGQLVVVGRPADLTASVGGDAVWISTSDPDALVTRIRDRFGVDGSVVGGRVRLEIPRGHEFVPGVIEAFPGQVDAISVSRPTLDEVFAHHTGRMLD